VLILTGTIAPPLPANDRVCWRSHNELNCPLPVRIQLSQGVAVVTVNVSSATGTPDCLAWRTQIA